MGSSRVGTPPLLTSGGQCPPYKSFSPRLEAPIYDMLRHTLALTSARRSRLVAYVANVLKHYTFFCLFERQADVIRPQFVLNSCQPSLVPDISSSQEAESTP